MFFIINQIVQFLNFLLTERSDPRVNGWFLMDSFKSILLIQITYLIIVLKIGPKLMEKRKAFNLDKLLIVYNFSQMLVNGYIFAVIFPVIFRTFNLYCNPVDYSDNPDSLALLHASHVFFLTKIIDLLDTIFFVLRKKEKQVTFLHVYHHFVMVIYCWVLTKFIGGGQTMYAAFFNTIVHVFMYGYYMLSVWKKEYKNSLWWKRHLTELQLVQFFIGFIVLLGPVLSKDCGYPPILSAALIPQNAFFLGLFGDFYLKTYILPKMQKEKAEIEIKPMQRNLLNMCKNQMNYDTATN